MFKLKIDKLINEFGIKKEKLIELIGSNRVTFGKKLKDNSFTNEEQSKIMSVYGPLL